MVSFNCNRCCDVVTKPKVLNHSRTCGSNSFSCVDCMQTFDVASIKPHTSCVSEVAKYQGKYQALPNGNPVKRARMPDSSDDEQPAPQPSKPRRVIPTFSDSDDDDDKSKKLQRDRPPTVAAVVPKVTKTTSAAVSSPAAPTAKPAASEVPQTKRASDDAVVMMPSFRLDTTEQLLDVLTNIFQEHAATEMSSSAVAKAVVERYVKRIARQIQPKIEAAVTESGASLGFQAKDGVISAKGL